MILRTATLLVFVWLTLSCSAQMPTPVSKETAFWQWFQKNEQRLFEFEEDMSNNIRDLGDAMKRVNPHLTFEIGPDRGGKREFIISADGIKDAFPAVNSLADSAPTLERWQIIRFRPRRELPPELRFEETPVKSDRYRFTLEKDGEKTGISLYIDGYTEKDSRLLKSVGFLLLDNCLGEYDVETKVGFIEFLPSDAASKFDKRPLSELTSAFDSFHR